MLRASLPISAKGLTTSMYGFYYKHTHTKTENSKIILKQLSSGNYVDKPVLNLSPTSRNSNRAEVVRDVKKRSYNNSKQRNYSTDNVYLDSLMHPVLHSYRKGQSKHMSLSNDKKYQEELEGILKWLKRVQSLILTSVF